ncbi:RNA polymerase III subunit C82 [Lecanora helva]
MSQLVFWHTSDKRLTTYEANSDSAHLLVRYGRYMKIAEDRVNKIASDIIVDILLRGHAKIGDLLQAYGLADGVNGKKSLGPHYMPDQPRPSVSKDVVDGIKGDQVTYESFREALLELLRLGILSKVNVSHFRSDADNRIEAEKVVPPVGEYKAKSKKEMEAQWETALVKQMEEWKYGMDNGISNVNSPIKGRKRPLDDTEDFRPEKRQRFSSPKVQQLNTKSVEMQPTVMEQNGLNDNTTLGVNHAKFAVMMRNDDLVKLAADSLCASTAKVYSRVLHLLEPHVQTCRGSVYAPVNFKQDLDLESLPQVTTDELTSVISSTEELADGLGSLEIVAASLTQGKRPKKRKKKAFDGDDASSDEDKDHFASDQEDSPVTVDSDEAHGDADCNADIDSSKHQMNHRETIRNHLLVLSRHPHEFLHRFPQTHILPERWTVNYPKLLALVVRRTFMNIITARYGILARRIAELLYERKGKATEKELASMTLLSPKPMRGYLSQLNRSGLIQTQEVPRDASRTPARCMYLWYFDVERCKVKIAEDTQQAMARCLQRVHAEGEKVKGTVEKANRSDVKGNEERFLTLTEREALETWEIVEDRIWGEVARLDDIFATMCDY